MRLDHEETEEKMNSLITSGDFISLLKEAEATIDNNPNSYKGYWWRGRALTFQGRLSEAVKAFYDSIKRANNDQEESKIMGSLANVFNVMKDHDLALNYSEVALELNPDNPVAVLVRGVALASTGRKKEASDHISSHWVKLRDSYERACGYAVTGQKNKMLEALRADLPSNPHHKVTILHDLEFKSYIKSPELQSLLKNS